MTHTLTPLLSSEQIARRVQELAVEIAQRCDNEIVVVGILKGSFVFLADLVRALSQHHVQLRIDFLALASYGKSHTSSGNVEVRMDFQESIDNKQVLLVDDILDTGRTFQFAAQYILDKGAREVLTCAFLDKPERRLVPFQTDFTAFTIPNAFVVGYGLDYAHHHRELPYVASVHIPDL